MSISSHILVTLLFCAAHAGAAWTVPNRCATDLGGGAYRTSAKPRVPVEPPDLRAVLMAEAQRVSPELAALDVFDEVFRFARIDGGRYQDEQKTTVDVAPFDLQLTDVPQWMTVLWLLAMGQVSDERLPHFRDDDGDGDHAVVHYGRYGHWPFEFERRVEFNHDHPTERQSAVDAEEFLAWVNGLEAVWASGCSYRLLTSEEWEWAVRSSTGDPTRIQDRRPFPDQELNEYVYSVDNSEGRTHSMRLLRALPNGLRHMLGHVNQLTSSIYGPYRLTRGGDWASDASYVRSTPHHVARPGDRYYSVGLRLVRTCP